MSGRGRVDLSTTVGSVALSNPILTAAGTSGHGAELGAYFDLSSLGAVVVKSLAAEPWPGNPPPRLKPVHFGMLNSVGLQGPGVAAWLEHDLPALVAAGATVVASIWGRSVEEFALAAKLLCDAPPAVVAVEVNVSCPNLDEDEELFAMSPRATAAAIDAARACGVPLWAKLTPAAPDLVGVASAALAAGAEALTLVNTMPADNLELEVHGAPLGAGKGGLSGPALAPIARRCISEVHGALPDAAIVAAGGVSSGDDALWFLSTGARAVEVGTATFADPRAAARVLRELCRSCERKGISSLGALASRTHD